MSSYQSPSERSYRTGIYVEKLDQPRRYVEKPRQSKGGFLKFLIIVILIGAGVWGWRYWHTSVEDNWDSRPMTAEEVAECGLSFDETDGSIAANSVSGEVEIPTSVDGQKVTTIADRGFFGCVDLSSLSIPESVTRIGDEAFCNCPNLEKIEIPATVEPLGTDILEGNTLLFHNDNKANERYGEPFHVISERVVHGKYFTITVPENWVGNVDSHEKIESIDGTDVKIWTFTDINYKGVHGFVTVLTFLLADDPSDSDYYKDCSQLLGELLIDDTKAYYLYAVYYAYPEGYQAQNDSGNEVLNQHYAICSENHIKDVLESIQCYENVRFIPEITE